LHRAARHGYLDIVRLLVKSGADSNIRDSGEMTPFDLAVDNGKTTVARLLVKCMRGVDSLGHIDLLPSNTASQSPRFNIATQSLIEHEETASVPDEKGTSLHTASEEGNLEVVQWLLQRGAYANERNARHRTALLLASANGRLEVAKLLIEYEAHVNSQDKFGWTPLHAASRFGHLDVLLMLLDNGADVNANMQGHWTPLHFASNFGHLEIVKTLLQRGADVHLRDDQGRTPSQIALRSGEREILRLLSNHAMQGS